MDVSGGMPKSPWFSKVGESLCTRSLRENQRFQETKINYFWLVVTGTMEFYDIPFSWE